MDNEVAVLICCTATAVGSTVMSVNPLFSRLGIPIDVDTLIGIQRLVNDRVSETRHLDFKQRLHNVDDLADDLSALANVGGGVLIIGVEVPIRWTTPNLCTSRI